MSAWPEVNEWIAVWSFLPDTIEWQDLELGYGAFVRWSMQGGLERFYEALYWDGWRPDIARLAPDRGIFLYPPPFTEQGADPNDAHRGEVPLTELWDLYVGGGLLSPGGSE